jgi:hypothetical protein
MIGAVIGLLGALVGLLAGKARARTLVMSILWLILVLGVCSLFTGIIALQQSQPYAVFYPLFLMGGISTVFSTCGIPLLRKRYEAHELRQISSMDASV